MSKQKEKNLPSKTVLLANRKLNCIGKKTSTASKDAETSYEEFTLVTKHKIITN